MEMKEETTFRVGDQVVSPQNVFIARKYVFAMVPPRPVVRGHVLVFPRRHKAVQLSDLSELEVLEMMVCAREIAKRFEEWFNVRNFNILLEEGKHSHSQFKTVCVQVLPHDERPSYSPEDTASCIRNHHKESRGKESTPEAMA